METALAQSDIPVPGATPESQSRADTPTFWGSALKGVATVTKVVFVAAVGATVLWAGSAAASGVLAATAPMLTSAGYTGAAAWATWLSTGALSVANGIVAGAALLAGYAAGAFTWLGNTALPAISSGFSGLFSAASADAGVGVAGATIATTGTTIGVLQAKKAGIFATQATTDNINDPNNFSLFTPEPHEMRLGYNTLNSLHHGHGHEQAIIQKTAIKNAAHHAADETLESINHSQARQGNFASRIAAKRTDGPWTDRVQQNTSSRTIDI